ncbi:MAG: hypothetical protein VYE64_01485 [Planctomycetota bacterium]|nr:hypothetical protein [Planctomycetota bacterium]
MNDVWIAIQNRRAATESHIGFVETLFDSPVEAARSFGLQADEQTFHLIDRDRAERLLAYLLRFDLAYGTERMTDKQTAEAIAALIKIFDRQARFYSNGDWDQRSPNDDSLVAPGVRWVPATDCTFDAGLLILGEQGTACLWFGDND